LSVRHFVDIIKVLLRTHHQVVAILIFRSGDASGLQIVFLLVFRGSLMLSLH
jgi:hypothetical protein